MSRFNFVFRALAFVALMLMAATSAHAQDYPNRTIRFVVTLGPGNSTDVMARLIAYKLNERHGWTVVVENRPGGQYLVGMQNVLQAPADGYTFLAMNSAMPVMPTSMKNLPFDLVKDFIPISRIGSVPLLLFSNRDQPFKTVAELVTYAKANPGKLRYAAFQTGSGTHLVGELLKQRLGLDIRHVPYNNSAFIADMASGNVELGVFSVTTAAPGIQTGQLRPLAILGTKRSPLFPDVPTIQELGFPPMDVDAWGGLGAKAGTPQQVIDLMNKEINEIVQLPDIQEKLKAAGATPAAETSQQFKAKIQSEIDIWAKLAKDADIKFD